MIEIHSFKTVYRFRFLILFAFVVHVLYLHKLAVHLLYLHIILSHMLARSSPWLTLSIPLNSEWIESLATMLYYNISI